MKALRPTTIIPPHLYVKREADRQLSRVVSDLGRPAYILVARQMGKTNLLINLKRERETQGDIVSYIDLSIRFSSARDLFRHIIDSIIESAEDKLGHLSDKVSIERASSSRPANHEYDRHLRLIARAAPNSRVVVILDEVDSLINCSYSDTILAQIRSMYFSRVTHSEYERVTYVLSGVAEPSDLIKDKSISPFNIGEKIYLDDFSRDEFDKLLALSNLTLTREVVDSIYDWTGGNPRMSWDVASRVEDDVIAGHRVSPESVARAVDQLYLRAFDRAPVDHIRVLAEENPAIRDAIMSLRYGKGDAIDDRLRSRMYLAGILGGLEGPIRIKCRIIDEALSEQWIRQVSGRKTDFLKIGADCFGRGEYDRALDAFGRYAAQPGFPGLPDAHAYQAAVSKFHVGDFPGAAADLSSLLERPTSAFDVPAAQHVAGAALVRIRETDRAIPLLEAAYSNSSGSLHHSVGLTLSSAYLAEDPSKYAGAAKRVLDELIASGMADLEQRASHEEIVATVRYNAAWAANELGDRKAARQHIDVALSETSAPYMPALYLQLLTTVTAHTSRLEAAENAADVIIDNALTPKVGPSYGIAYSTRTLACVLSELITLGARHKFKALFEDTINRLGRPDVSQFESLMSIMNIDALDSEAIERRPLFQWAVDNLPLDETPKSLRLAVLAELAIISPSSGRKNARDKYLAALFADPSPDDITHDNLLMLVAELNLHFSAPGTAVGTGIFSFVEQRFEEIREKYPHILAVILYQSISVYAALSQFDRSESAARAVIDVISATDLSDVPDQWKQLIPTARNFAENHLVSRALAQKGGGQTTVFDPYRNIGRNTRVRVKDKATQAVIERKFKLVEKDLRAGSVELVEVLGG